MEDGSLVDEIIFYFIVVMAVMICMAFCFNANREVPQFTQEISSPKR